MLSLPRIARLLHLCFQHRPPSRTPCLHTQMSIQILLKCATENSTSTYSKQNVPYPLLHSPSYEWHHFSTIKSWKRSMADIRVFSSLLIKSHWLTSLDTVRNFSISPSSLPDISYGHVFMISCPCDLKWSPCSFYLPLIKSSLKSFFKTQIWTYYH